jgi:putative MATE family efflux protein
VSGEVDSTRLERFVARPRRAVWSVSAPMIGGMMLHLVYMLTDTAFVGQLGHQALAGLTLVFPLFFVLVALANGIGSGITVLVSQAIGRQDTAEAERVGGSALAFGLIAGLLFSAVGLLLGRTLLRILGASGPVVDLAWDYFSVLAATATLPLCNAFVRSLLTGQGDARTPMMVMGLATVLNMGLDPLLIFVAKLGIRGAALSTAISQLVSLVTLLFVSRVSRRNVIRIRRDNLLPRLLTIRLVLRIGIPASLSQLLMSVASVLINRVVAHFGDGALAGYGAASRVDGVVVLPILGLSAGAVAVTGMFAGAGRADLVRLTTRYVYRWALIIAIGLGLPAFVASPWLLRLFTDHPAALAVGRQYLGFMVFVYPMMGVGMIGARLLLALGHPNLSLAITTLRLVVVTVPVAYLSVYLFGQSLSAVWWGVVGGAAAATTLSLGLVVNSVWRRNPTERAVSRGREATARQAGVAPS